jgi:hypothetical protein
LLRITRVDRRDHIVLRWEGRIGDPWLAEAERTGLDAQRSGLPVTIDLAGVSHLDNAGIELVRALHGKGFHLTNCSRYVAELLKGVAPC